LLVLLFQGVIHAFVAMQSYPLENVHCSEVFVVLHFGTSSSFGLTTFGFLFCIRLSQECSVQSSSMIRLVLQRSAAVCLPRRFSGLFFGELEITICRRVVSGWWMGEVTTLRILIQLNVHGRWMHLTSLLVYYRWTQQSKTPHIGSSTTVPVFPQPLRLTVPTRLPTAVRAMRLSYQTADICFCGFCRCVSGSPNSSRLTLSPLVRRPPASGSMPNQPELNSYP
jgi:hypothetical protein